MSKAAAPHEEWLDTELGDPEFAAHYLDEAFSGGKDEFLVALGNVVRARGGIQKMATAIGKTRPALHRALTHGGNPGFDIVYAVIGKLDLVPSFGRVVDAMDVKTGRPVKVLAAGGRKKLGNPTDWGLGRRKKASASVVAASRSSGAGRSKAAHAVIKAKRK